MSDLAPLLQRFFTDKLDRHLDASPHTKAAYADTFRLLLTYAERATGIAPSALTLADLDADLIGGFLQHLETERGNSVATRNARRAALRSFFTYASYRAPDAIATISAEITHSAAAASIAVPHGSAVGSKPMRGRQGTPMEDPGKPHPQARRCASPPRCGPWRPGCFSPLRSSR